MGKGDNNRNKSNGVSETPKAAEKFPESVGLVENGNVEHSEKPAVNNNIKQTTWGSQAEFILACIGYSVGLGNIWRFPYLCMANGGAAFLIAYFTCLVLCAMPLYFMEICMGQFSGKSAISVWSILPAFKGLGYSMNIVSGILGLYYNNIIAWTLFYLFKSFTSTLPWSHCDNWWNTPLCFINDYLPDNADNTTAIDELFVSVNKTYVEYSTEARVYANLSANDTIPWKSAADEFWLHSVLEISPGVEEVGGIRWEIFGCMWFAWVVTFLCFIKDIQSIGKIVYVTATAPYLLLTILLIRAATLPGAIEGLKYYFIPQMGKLLQFKVWAVACLQVFYSLGPGWGAVITMASFNKFNNNCIRDGIMVPIITGLTSFYGGIVVFCIVGFMASQTGNDVTSFIQSGPGLVFIAYPRALAMLPISPLWSIMFFLMIFSVGLGSMFCTVETMVGSFVDEFPKYLKKYKLILTIVVCVASAVVGTIFTTRAGVYYFQVTDWYVAAFSVMLIGIMECIAVAWVYGHERFYYDIELMTGIRPNVFWKICWGFVTPIMLFVLFVYQCLSMQEPTYGKYEYPRWMIGIGWFIAIISIVPIPVGFIIVMMRQKGSFMQRLKQSFTPSIMWGPANEELQETYKYTENGRALSHFLIRRAKPGLADEKQTAEC